MPDGINPFGEPDGSKPDFRDIGRAFVDFSDERAWGGLATRADDLTARIFVGRKGSGKTIYLRRQSDAAGQNQSLYAARIESQPPDTELVLKFANTIKGHNNSEFWRMAWSRAILRATACQLIAVTSLRDKIEPSILQRLTTEYLDLFEDRDPGQHERGVFSEMKHLLDKARTFHELNKYLHHDKWANLKDDVKNALRQTPPVCFFLDAVDEFYESAPRIWLTCQVGLFLAAMDLLRDERFGARLHVFACLRDAVMLSMMRSEHNTRYMNERYVRTLEWDMKSARVLLERKIDQLPTVLLKHRGKQDPMERWLGETAKYIESRKQKESMLNYFMRHTRLLPRDIIIQGNIVCQEIARAKMFPELDREVDPIRDGVRAASTRFGRELLDRCAQQILTDAMPDNAMSEGYASSYLERTSGLHSHVLKSLRTFLIKDVRYERIAQKRLSALEQVAHKRFGADGLEVLSALWLNGLVGYIDDGRSTCAVFYSHRHSGDLELPMNKRTYVVHASQIDCVGLRPKGQALIQCV